MGRDKNRKTPAKTFLKRPTSSAKDNQNYPQKHGKTFLTTNRYAIQAIYLPISNELTSLCV
jgi:hypothetical protein